MPTNATAENTGDGLPGWASAKVPARLKPDRVVLDESSGHVVLRGGGKLADLIGLILLCRRGASFVDEQRLTYSLSYLARHAKIRGLSIECQSQLPSVWPVKCLPDLETIGIDGGKKLRSLRELAGHEHLQEICVTSNVHPKRSLDGIQDVPNLRFVVLTCKKGDAAFLGGCRRLEQARLYYWQEPNFRDLRGTMLTDLNVYCGKLESLTGLEGTPIVKLALEGCSRLREMPPLPSLEGLTMRGNWDMDLTQVGRLAGLRYLSLWYTRCPPNSLDFLRQMKKLRIVSVGVWSERSAIPDMGWIHDMPELLRVDIQARRASELEDLSRRFPKVLFSSWMDRCFRDGHRVPSEESDQVRIAAIKTSLDAPATTVQGGAT